MLSPANGPMRNRSCRRESPWATLEDVQLLLLDDRDDIAIATVDLKAGDRATIANTSLVVRNDIRRGHKVALRRLPTGTDVLRYGEVIGETTADVEVGDHVHVHNLISKRIPGRDK